MRVHLGMDVLKVEDFQQCWGGVRVCVSMDVLDCVQLSVMRRVVQNRTYIYRI